RNEPRDLRGIAQFAFFAAASEGTPRIESRHAVIAIESWAARNASSVVPPPKTADAALHIARKEEGYSAPYYPAVAENSITAYAPPVLEQAAAHAAYSDVTADEASSAPNSLIRRQVLSFIEAEARHVPTVILAEKRRWIRRSVEMTVAF